jgi:hypothetical protein
MSWQLWVLIAAAATGLVVLLAVKLRHAQQVFDRIVSQPVIPAQMNSPPGAGNAPGAPNQPVGRWAIQASPATVADITETR